MSEIQIKLPVIFAFGVHAKTNLSLRICCEYRGGKSAALGPNTQKAAYLPPRYSQRIRSDKFVFACTPNVYNVYNVYDRNVQ